MKKSRSIKSQEEAQMFAYFLAMERNRHLEDIQKINTDIQNLIQKWDVAEPIPEVGEWIEV